jgi:hypothetical protein
LPILVNPFGVVYNPLSIKLVLERVIQATPFKESDLSFRNGLWYSYLHHCNYSSPDKQKCLDSINSDLLEALEFVNGMKYLLVTFGTSYVYFLRENDQPVANCHKIPAKEFENRLLTVDEILQSWSSLITNLLARTPDLKIIFTISPVRHWKDGAVGNQLSKSILNVAVHELLNLYPKQSFYFPSYEIMMDDLRDYRFYADDMLHPSKFAVEYIWEKFKGAFIDSKSARLIGEIEKILTAVNHRPFNPNTPEHRAFVTSILESIKRIRKDYPTLNFSKEETSLLAVV